MRRYHRVLAVTLLTLYVTSGLLMLMPDGEMSTIQAGLQIAIGVAHWLA